MSSQPGCAAHADNELSPFVVFKVQTLAELGKTPYSRAGNELAWVAGFHHELLYLTLNLGYCTYPSITRFFRGMLPSMSTYHTDLFKTKTKPNQTKIPNNDENDRKNPNPKSNPG